MANNIAKTKVCEKCNLDYKPFGNRQKTCLNCHKCRGCGKNTMILIYGKKDCCSSECTRLIYCQDCNKQVEKSGPAQKYCKECSTARGYKNQTINTRKSTLKGFGLDLDEYDELLSKQSNGCAICNKIDVDRHLAVDHNHDTGQIRGLLCRRCNTALGLFKDNHDLLISAAMYLVLNDEIFIQKV